MIKISVVALGVIVFALGGCSSSTPEPSNGETPAPEISTPEPRTASGEKTEEPANVVEKTEEQLDQEHVQKIEERERLAEQQIVEMTESNSEADETTTTELNSEADETTTTELNSEADEITKEIVPPEDEARETSQDSSPEATVPVISPLPEEAASVSESQEVAVLEVQKIVENPSEAKTAAPPPPIKKAGSSGDKKLTPEAPLLPVLRSDPETKRKAEEQIAPEPSAGAEDSEGLVGKIKNGAKKLWGNLFTSDSKGVAENPGTAPGDFESALVAASAAKLISCEEAPEMMDKIHQQLLKTKNLDVADRRLRDRRADRLMPVIHFDFDQQKIKIPYQKLLRRQGNCVLETLESRGDMIVQIEGHTDERGSEAYNLTLGHRRANAVANAIRVYLPASAIVRTFSYGEEFPLVRKSNPEAWSQNRRVEFTFLLKP